MGWENGRLNNKNGLDYYLSSESELDWDEEEPKYETLYMKIVKLQHTQNVLFVILNI